MISICSPSALIPETTIRRLVAVGFAAISWFCLQGLSSAPAEAQTDSVSWQNAIASLVSSNTQLSVVTVPSGVLVGSEGSAKWHFARAGLMLFAADVAMDNQFLVRRSQLLQEAEKSLVAARQSGLPAAQGSQCAYLLGYLEENIHNNLATAAAYYQQAVTLDSTNRQASNALARVQIYQARVAATAS